MNSKCVGRFALLTQLVLLGACGASDSGISLNPTKDGIEGSGHRITSSGAVTSIGSIDLNGVNYDLSNATITINDRPADQADLAPGQIAIVEGELDDDGRRGTATRVTVEIPIAGPITAIDTARNRVSVLGQSIAISGGTIIADGDASEPVGGLETGQDIEVSGFTDSTGLLHARRIEARRVRTPLLVTGTVTNLNPNSRSFTINGQPVDYATSTLSGSVTLADGARVRVTVDGALPEKLVAGDVRTLAASLPGAVGDAAAVSGWVTHYVSANEFDVDGHPVRRTTPDSTDETDIVQLDTFVLARGALVDAGVVQASQVEAVAPGRIVGGVTIAGLEYGLSGILTPAGQFRLSIGQQTGGSHETESSFGQLVGSFRFYGDQTVSDAVLIGETCAPPATGRFCGAETRVRIELTGVSEQAVSEREIDGASGVIRVATDQGEEVWPLTTGYWGARAGFDSFLSGPTELLAGVYEMHQAEFTQGHSVILSVDDGGRMFFQSAATGCVGNGLLTPDQDPRARYINVSLTIESCEVAFENLNAEFDGLALMESLTPWDYDLSVLAIWISTPLGSANPAAISMWAHRVD